jgi:GABA(A) receptor-associated protein
MLIKEFKSKAKDSERLEQAMKVISKYPERVPIFVESRDINLNKNKYLVPRDLTVGQFMYIIRKNMQLKSDEALFLFFGEKPGIIPPTGALISDVYEQHMDTVDHFLYGRITKENVFGY